METVSGFMKTAMLSLFITFFSLFGMVFSQFTTFNKLQMPPNVTGPESAAFNIFGEGPFTTVTDGRILKWKGSNIGFEDFAYTSPSRTKELCDGTTNPDLGPICGRPLGLSFNTLTGKLYIVDAYLGLLEVGPEGGLATQLVSGFKFTSGLDVDLLTGNVYFSVSSLSYEFRNITQPGFKPDSTGMFLRYNPFTKQVSVLLRGLFGGGGPAVNSDGTFVLVSEFFGLRVLKYWLMGPKANTAEPLLNVSGNPNKIKRAGTPGEFWVAVTIQSQQPTPLVTPLGLRVNAFGSVVQTVSFATQFFNKTISLVQEQKRTLYVGSRVTDFIGVYK